jgi:hypothetical protein
MRPRKALLVLAMLAFATTIAAQQPIVPPMSAQRSLALQADLQVIDANRAAWVDQFLASWVPYVDNTAYDIFSELGPIAMRVPAWQLYGASLVGDFNTMVEVLTGDRGAGAYINSIAAPEQKIGMSPAWSGPSTYAAETSIPGPGTAVFGDTDNEMVFTPIAPCRIVDTRGTGARTGVIAANTSRNFDLTTNAYTKGQGGATSGCTGLPSFSYKAWAVNITATGYTLTGGLKAWPFLGTEPNASIINYSALIYPAIANGQNLTGCYACADDIVIKAFTAPTHVIIDVVGYYREAGVADASVSRVAGTLATFALNQQKFVNGGACPTGTSLIGGEADVSNNSMSTSDDRQASSTTWTYFIWNESGGAATGTVYSRCMDTPVRVF